MKKIFAIMMVVGSMFLGMSKNFPDDFFEKKWSIKTLYSVFGNKTKLIFHKDSSRNLEYRSIKYGFEANHDFTVYLKDTILLKANWQSNVDLDSLYMSGEGYKIIKQDNQNLVLRSYTLQFADTSARLDTMFTYLHLIPEEVVTSSEDENLESRITLYPNPVKNNLNIEIPALTAPEGKVRLVNAYGQVVREEIISTNNKVSLSWDVQNIQKGMYYMVVLVDGKKRYSKVLVKE